MNCKADSRQQSAIIEATKETNTHNFLTGIFLFYFGERSALAVCWRETALRPAPSAMLVFYLGWCDAKLSTLFRRWRLLLFHGQFARTATNLVDGSYRFVTGFGEKG
jgi:hypothetical protein